ncbi:MAG TPA: hypothetical protein VGG16_29900 [Streptosporangiaceae bacterium]|jgi:hypothetical protein
MDTRADGYASTRTAGELKQVRDDLVMARAQAERGSLTRGCGSGG